MTTTQMKGNQTPAKVIPVKVNSMAKDEAEENEYEEVVEQDREEDEKGHR